jgi:hypothetical protein
MSREKYPTIAHLFARPGRVVSAFTASAKMGIAGELVEAAGAVAADRACATELVSPPNRVGLLAMLLTC